MAVHVGVRGPGHLSRVFGWTPLQLGASLLGWWDAERTDKLTLSGSAVTTWTDVVGAYAATQGVSGSRPVWNATSFNGRPGVTFDGSDDELTLASVPFPTGASACEIWALVDQTALVADTTSRRVFSYGGGNNTDSRQLMRAVTLGVNRGQMIVGDGAATATPSEATVDLSGRHVMRGILGATASSVQVDSAAGAGTAIVPATGSVRTRIGASIQSTAAAFWQGQIAAVLVTSALSTDQASQLLAYLKSRGGIA